ncbi:MAG: MotA/TolQ/ExbB proton channel family protein [Candidatus Eisenbacteria sp.]|nr:MotA/TolQ/ExbB proton channel family protein [Candidatus Eisenbacteria bacterium]
MHPATAYGPIEIWHSMGTVGHLVLIFLLVMSVYSTGIMIDRWLLLRKAHKQSLDFVRVTQRLLAENKLDEVVEEARKHPQSHLARIYSAAILDQTPGWETDCFAEGFEDTIRSATERESVLITQEFKRGLPGLASIAATAPFVGLFGTVVGIMNSFFGMAAAGSGGIGAVAGGIAEALVNTAAGILVALPAVWGFNYFLGQMERIDSEMSNASSELVDYFIKRSRSNSWKLEATTGRPASR